MATAANGNAEGVALVSASRGDVNERDNSRRRGCLERAARVGHAGLAATVLAEGTEVKESGQDVKGA
eukprot:2520064-Rhodomonas_salina.1